MTDTILFHLDLQTLYFLIAVLAGLIAMAFGGLWYQGVGRPATAPWAAGHGVAAVGYLLSAMRGDIPHLLSIVLGDTLILGGAMLILKALHLRTGRPFASGGAWAGVVAVALLFTLYTYVLPSLPARILVISVTGAAILTACGTTLLATPARERTWAELFMVVAFLVSAAGQVIRAILTLEYPPDSGLFGDAVVHGLSKAMLLGAIMAWTLAFLWLITMDLRRTLEQEVLSRRESERLFRAVFENTANGIALGDEEGRLLLVNEGFARLLGRPPEELQGRSFRDFTHPDDVEESINRVQESTEGGESPIRLEKRYLGPHGEPIWADLTLSRLRDTVGGGIRFIAVATDISDKKAAEEELEYQATYDALTGAVNRLHFESLLEREVERVARYGSDAALLMFDLDFFKVVNDTYGHDTGDAVLRGLTALVRERLRETDLLARWGGEEFMVLLPETDVTAAAKVAEDLRQRVATHCFAGDLAVTISLGVTGIRRDDTMKGLLKRVDDALYAAKHAGRNRLEPAAEEEPEESLPGVPEGGVGSRP